MCIIAIKVKGSSWPSVQILQNCIASNPDGFSMAWNDKGQIHNFQTMDKKEILKKYSEVSKLDPRYTGLIFHARIATHGSKRKENCHCWIGDGLAFAHNGILTNIPNRDDLTDSETFFRDYFLPIYRSHGMTLAIKVAEAIRGERNKFAWMNSNGDIVTRGDFIPTSENGAKGKLYFSNHGFIHQGGFFYTPSRGTNSYKVGARTSQPLPSLFKGKSTFNDIDGVEI